MSIDDMFLRDPRVAHCAELCGWNVYEMRGRLLDVWAVCYDQMTPLLSAGTMNRAAGHSSFSDHAIESGLARLHRSGKLSIAGVEGRIEYLVRKIESGRQGGIKSAESRTKEVKHPAKHTSSTQTSTPQAPGNPIPTAVATAIAPDGDSALESTSSASAKPAKKRAAPLPEAWKPEAGTANALAETEAANRGVSVPQELLKLADWARSNSSKKVDWDATWRNWLRNARGNRPQGQSYGGTRGGDILEWQLERVRDAEAREAAEAAEAAGENT